MRVLFLACTNDNGVRSLVQQRKKNRLRFPFINSVALSGLFSFAVPIRAIFSVRRKSGSSQLVKKLSAVL